MMGYRDPNDNDPEREAEYWDMILHDFGVDEYFRQREEQHPPKPDEEVEDEHGE